MQKLSYKKQQTKQTISINMANTSNPQFPCQFSPVEAFEIDKKENMKKTVSAALAGAFEVNENVLILQNEDGKSFLFDTNTILSETAGITPTAIRKYCKKNGYGVFSLSSVSSQTGRLQGIYQPLQKVLRSYHI